MVDDNTAWVFDCSQDRGERYSAEGELLSGADDFFKVRQSVVVLSGGRWVVSDLYVGGGVSRPPVTAAEITAKGQDPDELWRIVTCPINQDSIAANPMIRFDGILTAWQIDDTPPRLLYDFVIARAYASVELPVQLGDAAPYGDDQAPMITQLPTWLWIDPAIWQPVSATTPPLFGITATVTATPIRVVFQGADQWVDCGPNLLPPPTTGPARSSGG